MTFKRIRSVPHDYIEIAGKIKHMTEQAILFDDGVKTVWLPKSKIEDFEIKDGVATVIMAEWLAIEKELI